MESNERSYRARRRVKHKMRYFEKKADSHAVKVGVEGDAADEVRALPKVRQLERDLGVAGRIEDRLGNGDRGGQRQGKASAGTGTPAQSDHPKADGSAKDAYEEGGHRHCGLSPSISQL